MYVGMLYSGYAYMYEYIIVIYMRLLYFYGTKVIYNINKFLIVKVSDMCIK